MEKLIRKAFVEQFNFFSFYYIWGYFYFSASYLFYKNFIDNFPNENKKYLNCIAYT